MAEAFWFLNNNQIHRELKAKTLNYEKIKSEGTTREISVIMEVCQNPLQRYNMPLN